MKQKINPGVLMLVMIFLLSGCYNLGANKRSNQFEQTSNSYRIYIRWGEYEKAGAFIKMRNGTPRELDMGYLKQIHVTRYDIVNEFVNLDEEDYPKEIVEYIDLDFYPESSLVVQNFKFHQVWWYDVEKERWFLDSDLPDFELIENSSRRGITRNPLE